MIVLALGVEMILDTRGGKGEMDTEEHEAGDVEEIKVAIVGEWFEVLLTKEVETGGWNVEEGEKVSKFNFDAVISFCKKNSPIAIECI